MTTHKFYIHSNFLRGLWKIGRNAIFQSLESTDWKSKKVTKTFIGYFKAEKLGLAMWIHESESGVEGHLKTHSEFASGFRFFIISYFDTKKWIR